MKGKVLAQDTVQDTSGHSTLAAVSHPYDVRSGPALEPRAPRGEAVAADRRLTHALRKKSSNLSISKRVSLFELLKATLLLAT